MIIEPKETETPKQETPKDKQEIKLESKNEFKLIPHNEVVDNLLNITIKAPKTGEEDDEDEDENSVCLSTVVDRSGSMSGKPYELCLQTLRFLNSNLKESDVFGCIDYGSDVNESFPLTKMDSKETKEQLLQNINNIKINGMTNMAGGIFKSISQHLGFNITVGYEYNNKTKQKELKVLFPGAKEEKQKIKNKIDLLQNKIKHKKSECDISKYFDQTDEEGFYKLDILLGSTHKQINNNGYEWKAFVKPKSGNDQEIFDNLISKVQFNLSPQFQQPKQVVYSSPFEIEKKSSNEFEMGVFIYSDYEIKSGKTEKVPGPKPIVFKPNRPIMLNNNLNNNNMNINSYNNFPIMSQMPMRSEMMMAPPKKKLYKKPRKLARKPIISEAPMPQFQPQQMQQQQAIYRQSEDFSIEKNIYSKYFSHNLKFSKSEEIKEISLMIQIFPKKKEKKQIIEEIKKLQLEYENIDKKEEENMKKILSGDCNEYKDKTSVIFLLTDGYANVGISKSQELSKAVKLALDFLKEKKKKVTLFCFGFGRNHDEKLMQSLCEIGNGLYYYVENNEDIGKSFANALGGVFSVFGEDIKLKIESIDDCVIKSVETGYPKKEIVKGKVWEVTMPDIYTEEERDILVDVQLNKINDNQFFTEIEKQKVLKYTIEFTNVKLQKKEKITQYCTVDRTNKKMNSNWRKDPENIDEGVDKQRNRILVAKTLKEASNMKDYKKAKKILLEAKEKVKKSKSNNSEYSSNIIGNIDECLENMNNVNDFKSAQKQITSYSMQHQQQRATHSGNMYQNCKKKKMAKKWFGF